MTEAETENGNPALEEASRELQAATHDAQVAYDCIALGDIDRAHTHALTAKIAADAAVTAEPGFRFSVVYFHRPLYTLGDSDPLLGLRDLSSALCV